MKRIMIVMLLLSMTLMFAEANYYVNNVVVELAVDEAGSPDFINAVDAVKANYNVEEVVSINYYPESSVYGNAETQAYIDTYFNQTNELQINGGNVLTGVYQSAIENYVTNEYFLASPVKMNITSFDVASGAVVVNIERIDAEADLANLTLDFVLIQNNISTVVTNVARDIESQSLDITQDNTELSSTFTINGTYNQDELAVVINLRDSNSKIIQSISSYDAEMDYIRAAVPYERVYEGTESGLNELPYFYVFTIGANATITANMTGLDTPDGWILTYCDEFSCFFGETDFEVNGQRKFHPNVVSNSAGEVHFEFSFINEEAGLNVTVPFLFHTPGVDNENDSEQSIITNVTNYPNPFNPKTSISFNLQQNDNVKIDIFSIKGRYIETIANKNFAKGNHSVDWNAENLSSGIYFYKLSTSNYETVKKITLLK